MVDWTPLIAALAALIGALAVQTPALILLWRHSLDVRANGAGIARIETATNGTNAALMAENAALRAQVSAFAAASAAPILPAVRPP